MRVWHWYLTWQQRGEFGIDIWRLSITSSFSHRWWLGKSVEIHCWTLELNKIWQNKSYAEMRCKAVWSRSIDGGKNISRAKSWGKVKVVDCFLLVCSPLAISLKYPQKPGLSFHQIAFFDSGYNSKTMKNTVIWAESDYIHITLCSNTVCLPVTGLAYEVVINLHLSPFYSVAAPWVETVWESEPYLVSEGLLGGDWSESESCLFWSFLATADWSGERFLVKDYLRMNWTCFCWMLSLTKTQLISCIR